MHFATRAIHAAQPSDPATGSLIAPIYQTSTYEQESPGVNHGFDYSRTNNPTRQRLEQVGQRPALRDHNPEPGLIPPQLVQEQARNRQHHMKRKLHALL